MDDSAALHRLKTVEDRQATVRRLLSASGETPETDVVFDFGSVDPAVYDRACESLTAQVSIPVGIVGPLDVRYRNYREAEDGVLVVDGEPVLESVLIPMATHEGGLNASLNRGIKAANLSGGMSTYVMRSSMTRGSCYVFESVDQAYRFSQWVSAQTARFRSWLEDPQNPLRDAEMGGIPLLSRHARLQSVRAYVVSTSCHVVFSYSTGDACGQNMTTRNTYMLHSHVILPEFHKETGLAPVQFFLEANTGGDKKSSHLYHIGGGHGTTVIASTTVSEDVLRETLKCSMEDLLKLREVGSEGSALAGMIGMSVNPVNVLAAIFAATGQDLACVGTSSMAISSTTECPGGLHFSIRLPSLEIGTVGGGTGLPHQRQFLEMMHCAGVGCANKFAQMVAAATLCLEMSTSCAMAAAGSASFYTAHLERGGMKRGESPTPVSRTLMDQLEKGGRK